ncbi:hypothetical protein C0R09_18825 [Brevibacillus laterosporus]|uniref:hypothetical protein n=1 Tax=Brevibacillus laterosporus TaxID=1465 RepID=UPI000C76C72E|nr:hypothetical protein [Brevibacillus laterosporus]AUM66409.1 hypothetical protein C0R09_18825 [Brevibacillus laterosporus]
MANFKTVNGVQYRVVTDRDAQVGDYVFYDESPRSYIEEGKPYEVMEVDSFGDPYFIDEEGDECDTWLDRYELLEKIGTVPNELVTHDGVTYRKVARDARVGDRFIISSVSRMDCTAGKVYEITELDKAGDPHFIDDVNEKWFLQSGDYAVLEPASIDEELAAAQARVAELEAMKKKKANRLKVGEYAKVVKADMAYASVGQIVKVVCDDESRTPYRAEDLDERITGWFREDGLVRATDEEVAEALRKQALDQFEPGDKVRLISGGRELPLFGFDDGGIYTVGLREDDDRVTIKRQDGKKGYAKPDQLEKVTDKEAKWAEIGRKVGKFKVGDTVRFLGASSCHGLNEHVGIITTVVDDDGTSMPYRLSKPAFVESTDGTWTKADQLELIAPVESVVNLRVA